MFENNKNYTLWDDLTFKTTTYRKNFDIIIDGENIITEHIGAISKIQMFERKPPIILGDYGFTTLNIRIAKELNIDVVELIHEFNPQLAYEQLEDIINNYNFNVYDYDKILIIQNLVISKEYRKMGVVEEFIEMLYREHYGERVGIISLVLPFQYNPFDFEYYNKYNKIKIKDDVGEDVKERNVIAMEHFSLNELVDDKDDRETNEYKLFAVADRCGFKRIGESYLFLFTPEKIKKRLNEKWSYTKKLNKLSQK
ncbi:MAG: hypothetical protein ACOC22_00090 [bacterium]